MFIVTWYNPTEKIYDHYYTPVNYLEPNKARLTSKYSYSNYIDTTASLSQIHSYIKGYALVDNIFTDPALIEWLKHSNTTNYRRFKAIVDKVEIT